MSDQQNKSTNELVSRLSHLAMEWRSFHSRRYFDDAIKTVLEYHKVFLKLSNLGWDGGDLLPDAQLPDEFMPKYYLDRWKNNIHAKISLDDIRFIASVAITTIKTIEQVLKGTSQITEPHFTEAVKPLVSLMEAIKNIETEALQIIKSQQEQDLRLIYDMQIGRLASLCDAAIKILTHLKSDWRIDNVDSHINTLEIHKRHLTSRLEKI